MKGEIKVNGKDYSIVDTVEGKPVILEKDYIAAYKVAGVDGGSPLTVEHNNAIVAEDGLIVGYFGYEE